MSINYRRPKTIDEALDILGQKKPRAIPMGGGSSISHYSGEPITVVDLQDLRLNEICSEQNETRIGSMVTISMLESSAEIPDFVRSSSGKELNENLRNSATLGGVLFSGSPRSILSVVLNAADSKLKWLPGKTTIPYGEFLAQKEFWNQGKLIEGISIARDICVGFEFISRTPDDVPFLIVACAKWPSGRIRVVLGGTGKFQVVVADGKGIEGIETGVKIACSQTSDHWATSEYRAEIGVILFRRLQAQLLAVA